MAEELRIRTGAAQRVTIGGGGAQSGSIRTETEAGMQIRSGTPQRMEATGGAPAHRFMLGGVIPVPERDYEKLENKPQINGVTLIGNKSSEEIGIEETEPLTNLEIEALFQSVFSDMMTEG